MFFKKISENEYHLYVSRFDLRARNISMLEEVIYNRPKSRAFFNDVATQAYNDFGFCIQDYNYKLVPYTNYDLKHNSFAVFSFTPKSETSQH